MSETSEVEAIADEGELTEEMDSITRGGSSAAVDGTPPSTAASTTETIDSGEEAHYCDEWELFSDAKYDASDDGDSADGQGEEERINLVAPASKQPQNSQLNLSLPRQDLSWTIPIGKKTLWHLSMVSNAIMPRILTVSCRVLWSMSTDQLHRAERIWMPVCVEESKLLCVSVLFRI